MIYGEHVLCTHTPGRDKPNLNELKHMTPSPEEDIFRFPVAAKKKPGRFLPRYQNGNTYPQHTSGNTFAAKVVMLSSEHNQRNPSSRVTSGENVTRSDERGQSRYMFRTVYVFL